MNNDLIVLTTIFFDYISNITFSGIASDSFGLTKNNWSICYCVPYIT